MERNGSSVSIASLRKSYGPGKVALADVSFELGQGVFGLLGPNGAGKSSFLEILSGNMDYDGGTIAFADGVGPRTHPARWRRRVGFMPQLFDFPVKTTGRELLLEAGYLLGLDPGSVRVRSAALLKRVNLDWAADRYAAEYSRGMKQRLGFALAILHDPALLLLDEPTAGLDPVERVLFRDLLAQVALDRVVVLSTHIVPDVERLCNRIGVLSSGIMQYIGSPEDFVAKVAGRVWEIATEGEGDAERLFSEGRAVSVRKEGQRGVRVRVVGSGQPGEGAEAVTATLEDAYFDLLGGRI